MYSVTRLALRSLVENIVEHFQWVRFEGFWRVTVSEINTSCPTNITRLNFSRIEIAPFVKRIARIRETIASTLNLFKIRPTPLWKNNTHSSLWSIDYNSFFFWTELALIRKKNSLGGTRRIEKGDLPNYLDLRSSNCLSANETLHARRLCESNPCSGRDASPEPP